VDRGANPALARRDARWSFATAAQAVSEWEAEHGCLTDAELPPLVVASPMPAAIRGLTPR